MVRYFPRAVRAPDERAEEVSESGCAHIDFPISTMQSMVYAYACSLPADTPFGGFARRLSSSTTWWSAVATRLAEWFAELPNRFIEIADGVAARQRILGLKLS